MPSVIKRGGSRAEYDRDKLRGSHAAGAAQAAGAARERSTRRSTASRTSCCRSAQREVKSEKIGELVMRELKRLDKVAYIRFASVYRSFEDVDEFAEVVKEVRPAGKAAKRRRAGLSTWSPPLRRRAGVRPRCSYSCVARGHGRLRQWKRRGWQRRAAAGTAWRRLLGAGGGDRHQPGPRSRRPRCWWTTPAWRPCCGARPASCRPASRRWRRPPCWRARMRAAALSRPGWSKRRWRAMRPTDQVVTLTSVALAGGITNAAWLRVVGSGGRIRSGWRVGAWQPDVVALPRAGAQRDDLAFAVNAAGSVFAAWSR
ncbi:MAG: ATP cone domain-containing protein [Comamonadaceae bacterium]|nr:ATP cone domain-containing protein [Comamonadaceae bacterium]